MNDKSPLSNQEVEQLWQAIQTANADEAHKRKRRRVWLTTSIVSAACVAGLLVVSLLIKPTVAETDIENFARHEPPANYQAPNTQLILSDKQTVELKEKESVIVYDSTSIKVNNHPQKIVNTQPSTYNRLIVPMGKRSTLTLADGSRLWVNAGTQVVYPVTFQDNRREIYVDGEIYIDVAADATRPFVVKTKEIDVQVIGTEFNVTSYDDETVTRVVLVKGAVNITDKSNRSETVLAPDEMFEHNPSGDRVESVDVSLFTAWKEGMFIFRGDRISTILRRLSKYYGEEIVCDEASGELRCSGKLDLKSSLDEVLRGLTITAPIAYSREQQTHVINYQKNP
ncbi:MAG: FecR domain-containing protein [Mediterranea sp.]|jgi:ferric-dicitrate binding protein FerR (iron transport regulator)|nr:FecR domain-containing protein [Mediterranea sp.]